MHNVRFCVEGAHCISIYFPFIFHCYKFARFGYGRQFSRVTYFRYERKLECSMYAAIWFLCAIFPAKHTKINCTQKWLILHHRDLVCGCDNSVCVFRKLGNKKKWKLCSLYIVLISIYSWHDPLSQESML